MGIFFSKSVQRDKGGDRTLSIRNLDPQRRARGSSDAGFTVHRDATGRPAAY
ncbi:hypothetical protein L681_18455 [Stenotrophomonas maltophilia MF89]|nr:hypothetical protein L681_18455 [Stenotrophomonas maltophilia MF89]